MLMVICIIVCPHLLAEITLKNRGDNHSFLFYFTELSEMEDWKLVTVAKLENLF